MNICTLHSFNCCHESVPNKWITGINSYTRNCMLKYNECPKRRSIFVIYLTFSQHNFVLSTTTCRNLWASTHLQIHMAYLNVSLGCSGFSLWCKAPSQLSENGYLLHYRRDRSWSIGKTIWLANIVKRRSNVHRTLHKWNKRSIESLKNVNPPSRWVMRELTSPPMQIRLSQK